MLLMENAARGVCDVVFQRLPNAERIVIVCGPGNNGGDGLALARQLAAHDVSTEVVVFRTRKKLTNDAETNLNILTAAKISVQDAVDTCRMTSALQALTEKDLVVDCLLGTGVRGAPRAPFCELINAINDSPARVLAVDIPSGLDCDSGIAEGACVRADRTVTFVGLKQGFLVPGANTFTGEVTVAHIGLPAAWVRDWLIARRSRSA